MALLWDSYYLIISNSSEKSTSHVLSTAHVIIHWYTHMVHPLVVAVGWVGWVCPGGLMRMLNYVVHELCEIHSSNKMPVTRDWHLKLNHTGSITYTRCVLIHHPQTQGAPLTPSLTPRVQSLFLLLNWKPSEMNTGLYHVLTLGASLVNVTTKNLCVGGGLHWLMYAF